MNWRSRPVATTTAAIAISISRPGTCQAIEEELSLEEITRLADQALELGALWCLITGGEPLLRPDFPDIYLALKKKGLLISVFTNAGLLTGNHVKLFRDYPPRDLEVTVYGHSPQTYEAVTRRPGSHAAFRKGLDLLLKGGVKVRLKAMALRSNVHELTDIAQFCRRLTSDYFRFDPLLHLRYDRDLNRNKDIAAERLTPEEIAQIERLDRERFQILKKECSLPQSAESGEADSQRLFSCGAGMQSFSVSSTGIFRLCSSLWHPDCIYDLRQGTLKEAWWDLVPGVRALTSKEASFQDSCGVCQIPNLCLWCPAHAYLETGHLDRGVPYFCETAHERARNLGLNAPRPIRDAG